MSKRFVILSVLLLKFTVRLKRIPIRCLLMVVGLTLKVFVTVLVPKIKLLAPLIRKVIKPLQS